MHNHYRSPSINLCLIQSTEIQLTSQSEQCLKIDLNCQRISKLKHKINQLQKVFTQTSLENKQLKEKNKLLCQNLEEINRQLEIGGQVQKQINYVDFCKKNERGYQSNKYLQNFTQRQCQSLRPQLSFTNINKTAKIIDNTIKSSQNCHGSPRHSLKCQSNISSAYPQASLNCFQTKKQLKFDNFIKKKNYQMLTFKKKTNNQTKINTIDKMWQQAVYRQRIPLKNMLFKIKPSFLNALVSPQKFGNLKKTTPQNLKLQKSYLNHYQH